MVKVINKRSIGKHFTVDIQVGDTNEGSHTYLMPLESGDTIVSHNSVSLLAGAVPGVHFPISKFYIRRIRLMKDSPFIKPLIEAGYKVEPCEGSEKTTVVVEFPVSLGNNIRTQDEVSVWEKVALAVFIQENWADNQVSVTIDFDAKTEADQIEPILNYYQYKLKSISFLPRDENRIIYRQAPYEKITEEVYNDLIKNIKELDLSQIHSKKSEEIETDIFCDTDQCLIIKKEKFCESTEESSVDFPKKVKYTP